MANAVRTGVNVPDFRHVTHHSRIIVVLRSNIFSAFSRIIMTKIEAQIEINAASDMVWELISDLDNEPKFWKGTKSVKNISKEDKYTVNREVTIAFRNQKCLQRVKIYPKEKIVVAKFTKGIIDGEKTITLRSKDGKTILYTCWDIKLTGMMSVFTGVIKKHIKNGTHQAMAGIKKEAERQIWSQ